MRSQRVHVLALMAAAVHAAACVALVPSPAHLYMASEPRLSISMITPEPQPPDRHGAEHHIKRTTSVGVQTITVAAALPSTAPEYSAYSLFTSAVLNSTNLFRRQHNATAATWNATLAQFADDYLANDTDCTFAHSGGPYGENLAVGYASVHGAVDAWGNERNEYDFTDPGFTEATGHFSQLVWKTSTTVGCGRRLCGGTAHGEQSTGWFLACEYWPRGNIIGQFAAEVDRQVAGGGSSSSQQSSGVIIGAVVIMCFITAAFAMDVRMNTQEQDA